MQAEKESKEKDTHRQIVEVAERLFRQIGFQKTMVADIARELHMSPANVYRFFAAKSEINEAVCMDLLGKIEAEAGKIAALEAGRGSQRPDINSITLSIEAKLRRAGKGKRLVIANGAEAEANAGLVELIKDAFTIRIQLLSGSDASIEAMSGRLGMNKGRLTSLIRLSYLAPDIVRALLEGRQPIELTPTQLLRLSKDLPHDWSEQRHVLDFAA